MENPVLKCKNLTKKIREKYILQDVSFELNSGEILAFIGPNGAGKTTTIKLILGLQSITSGTVEINGFNTQTNFVEAIEKVGAIVENPDFYMYLTGRKNLELMANMYKNIGKDRVDEVIKLVGLENRINDKVSKYSLGMRQRLGIAQAIINKPNLLILDEPTNGLDPEGIRDLREFLVRLAKEENMAVFVSSHNLAELESLCTRVCIIKQGKIIENATIDSLKENVAKEKSSYIIEINDTGLLKENENIDVIDGQHFKLNLERKDIPEFIKSLVADNIEIYEVKEEKITLEDAFLKKAGGNKIG